MGLDIGPGVDAWIKAHQGTPQSNEIYLGPDFPCSATAVQLADSQGQPVRVLVGYDRDANQIMEPGPGVPITTARLTMYDAVSWRAIPDTAQAVAGYVNGANSAWPLAAWDRFKALNIPILRIDVIGNAPLDSDVLDIERGDVDPSDSSTIQNWLDAHQATAWLYCSTSVIDVARASAAGRAFKWWAAHYTGVAHMELGSDATQWTDPAFGSGGDYDLSLINGDAL